MHVLSARLSSFEDLFRVNVFVFEFRARAAPPSVADSSPDTPHDDRPQLLRWHGRAESGLEVVAINDSGGVKQASHLVKYDSILGTFAPT